MVARELKERRGVKKKKGKECKVGRQRSERKERKKKCVMFFRPKAVVIGRRIGRALATWKGVAGVARRCMVGWVDSVPARDGTSR